MSTTRHVLRVAVVALTVATGLAFAGAAHADAKAYLQAKGMTKWFPAKYPNPTP